MRNKLFDMVNNLGQNKIALAKTPITIQEDLDELEDGGEEEIQKMINDLETFFEPVTVPLGELINPVPDVQEEVPVEPVKGGKGAPPKKDDKKAPAKAPAKAAAKGGKGGELAAYESTLPLPLSGIESLVLFIDNRIEALPIESLKVFSKIPVVCRDFNLHMYNNRLKNIGHQAPLHNN